MDSSINNRNARIMKLNKWIIANNKTPSHNHLVLVLLENSVIRLCKYKLPTLWKKGYWDIPVEWFPVTHWMELPKPEDVNESL